MPTARNTKPAEAAWTVTAVVNKPSLPRQFAQLTPSPADHALLIELGLKPWVCGYGDEIMVGEVRPFADWQTPDKTTVIEIYVSARGSQSWRFEIVAPDESTGELKRRTLTTGTVNLVDVWQSVLFIADGTLTVGDAGAL